MKKYDADRLESIKYLIKNYKYSIALNEILNYIEDYPDNMYAKYQYGIILQKLNRFSEALNVFFDIYNAGQQNKYSALYEVARIKVLQEEYDEARLYFQKVLDESPYYEAFAAIEFAKLERKFGNVDIAEKILQDAVKEKNGDNRKYVILELAKLKIKKNKRREAAKLIEMLKGDDNHIFKRKVLNLKGKLEVAYDNYDEALKYFNESLGNVKDGIYWVSLFEIARIYEMQGKLQESYEICQRVKKANNLSLGDVDLLLARIYQKQGNFELAKELYLELMNNKNAFLKHEALFRIGLLELDSNQIEKAKEYLKKSLSIKHLYMVNAYFALLFIAIREKKYDECYAIIEKLNELELSDDMISDLERTVFYLNTVTGKPITKDRELLYSEKQIVNYSEELALEHIFNGHAQGEKHGFSSNVDINALFYGIGDLLPKGKLDINNLMDSYVIDFPNVANYQGEEIHKLRVVCLPGTQNIITMYPYYKEKDDQDLFEVTQKEEANTKKKVVKRMSQIEKFNARYGKK